MRLLGILWLMICWVRFLIIVVFLIFGLLIRMGLFFVCWDRIWMIWCIFFLWLMIGLIFLFFVIVVMLMVNLVKFLFFFFVFVVLLFICFVFWMVWIVFWMSFGFGILVFLSVVWMVNLFVSVVMKWLMLMNEFFWIFCSFIVLCRILWNDGVREICFGGGFWFGSWMRVFLRVWLNSWGFLCVCLMICLKRVFVGVGLFCWFLDWFGGGLRREIVRWMGMSWEWVYCFVKVMVFFMVFCVWFVNFMLWFILVMGV